MNMTSHNSVSNGPVMRAAKKALESGNANHVLIWVPEESENTLKNLLEKACCERNTNTDANSPTIEWYFSTVNRLHAMYCGPYNLDIPAKTPEEKTIIFLAERACRSGNFDEITTAVQYASWEEMRQRFHDLMKKRDYDVDNVAAGRAYVSAFTAFVAQVNRLRSGLVKR